MLTYPIAAAAFVLLFGPEVDAASTPKQKMDFVRAMKKAPKTNRRNRKLSSKDHQDFKAALYGDSKESSALRKKFMKKSTAVNNPEGERKLQNYNGNGNGNGNANNGNGNGNGNNKQRDGSDDYFAATGDWDNIFGFDVSQYSLSYHRCASVRQYDDEIAQMEGTDSVFSTKHFAVFRFCPEMTCMGLQQDEDDCDEDTYGQEYCEMIRQQEQEEEENNNANGYWFGGNDDEEVIRGARGEGCESNYGEYMIELEDYLQLMLEYNEQRFEQYCEYCEECMWEVYQYWLEHGGNNRKLSYDEFKNSEEGRELYYNPNVDKNFYKVCPEYNTCSEYAYTCKQGMDQSYVEYFECTEMERNNGQTAYIAPHCAEDGFTVTLGVYSDEYCNEYIGNGVDIANYLGEEMDVEEDALKQWYNSANGALSILEFSNDEEICIPCKLADLPYGESDYVPNDDDTDDYEQYMAWGENEVNEICTNLYMVSARCDKHYRSYSSKTKRANFAEAVAQENLSCDFIDSIVMGNYDELGYVNVGDDYTVEAQPGWLQNNMYTQQYGHYITEVTPLQIFGLIISILAVVILASWAMSMQRSLSKRGPWRPRRGANSVAEPADINRQNSGIVMGRSMTDASYYMS